MVLCSNLVLLQVSGMFCKSGNPCAKSVFLGLLWKGDRTWRKNIATVKQGGDILSLDGGIPTEAEASELISLAGGTYLRTEGAHPSPDPHYYRHINYITETGIRSAIRILE